jgi:hypothetical protein
MEIYSLIIIVLSILLLLLILYNYNISVTENFTSNYDTNDNILGNILDLVNPNIILYNKIFKKLYRITGFYVEGPDKYSVKLNGSFVSHNESVDLVKGKYYDIADLNVKSKTIEISSKDANITKVIIYGLNTYNTKSIDIYNKSSLLLNNDINYKNGIIKFKNGVNCLIDYLELPNIESSDITDNISIKYKNKYNPTFQNYESGISNFLNKFHIQSSKIYFDKPLLATELKFNNEYINIIKDKKDKIVIYGKIATETDINEFKLESEIADSNNELIVEGGKCPPMKEIITKQKLINDLCNSISEKDKIRNQQEYYEKTKKYIGKLQKQNTQIEALKTQIEMLKADNNNSSISIQEKIASAQSMINDINTSNPFNKIALNYDESTTQAST